MCMSTWPWQSFLKGDTIFFCRQLRRKEVPVTPTPSPPSPAVSKGSSSTGIREYPKPGRKRRANEATPSKTSIIHPPCPFPTLHPSKCAVLQYPLTPGYCQFCSPTTPPHLPTAPDSQFYCISMVNGLPAHFLAGLHSQKCSCPLEQSLICLTSHSFVFIPLGQKLSGLIHRSTCLAVI